MCLILQQTRGTTIPASELTEIVRRNGDGFGLMYARKGQLYTHRMVGTKEEIIAAYYSYAAGRSAFLHWRMATHGHVNEANAHPFLLEGTNVAVMHNGIVDVGTPAEHFSDTWHLCQYILAPIVRDNPDAVFTPEYREVLADMIGTSNKIVLLSGDGRSQILNKASGVKFRGCWYSNTYAWPAPASVRPAVAKSVYHGESFGSGWDAERYRGTNTSAASRDSRTWPTWNTPYEFDIAHVAVAMLPVDVQTALRLEFAKTDKSVTWSAFVKEALTATEWDAARLSQEKVDNPEWFTSGDLKSPATSCGTVCATSTSTALVSVANDDREWAAASVVTHPMPLADVCALLSGYRESTTLVTWPEYVRSEVDAKEWQTAVEAVALLPVGTVATYATNERNYVANASDATPALASDPIATESADTPDDTFYALCEAVALRGETGALAWSNDNPDAARELLVNYYGEGTVNMAEDAKVATLLCDLTVMLDHGV